jgi:hypothetical protein
MGFSKVALRSDVKRELFPSLLTEQRMIIIQDQEGRAAVIEMARVRLGLAESYTGEYSIPAATKETRPVMEQQQHSKCS